MTQQYKEEVDTEELEDFETLEINDGLCKDCTGLVASFFSDDEGDFEAAWKEIRRQGRYRVLRTFSDHHHGIVASLVSSVGSGCLLCTLFYALWKALCKEEEIHRSYHILTLGNAQHSGRFYVLFDDLPNLTDKQLFSISSDAMATAVSLQFYRRNGDESNWQYFKGLRNSSRRRTIPSWRGLEIAPNLYPNSEEAVDRAKSWLSTCFEKHSECTRLQKPLPKRILDLSKVSSSSVVSLYLSKGEVIPYVTLSYSWGKSLPLTTTTSNLQQHCRAMPLQEFPQTLRDAIRVAVSLNFQYIWIDALCIIQDDPSDWEVQAALMTEIYEGSTLNISALSAKECDSGFLHKLPNTLTPVGKYRFPAGSKEYGNIHVGLASQNGTIEDEHLCTRGWAFQERLVSVASLHYTSRGMFWECTKFMAFASETNHGLTPREGGQWKDGWAETRQKLKCEPGDISNRELYSMAHSGNENSTRSIIQNWYRFVSTYSGRNITKEQDKLPAIGGIARSLATHTGLTYLAGLWKEDFLSGLLWLRDPSIENLVTQSEFRAPSWSWASVDGMVKTTSWFVQSVDPALDLVISMYDVKTTQKGTFGQVKSASIKATGLLQSVILKEGTPQGSPNYDSSTFTIIEGLVPGVTVTCMLDKPSDWPSAECSCFCLRLGTFNGDGRNSVAMLLIKQTGAVENQFCRVGAGETVVWGNGRTHGIEDSHDIFQSGKRVELTLV